MEKNCPLKNGESCLIGGKCTRDSTCEGLRAAYLIGERKGRWRGYLEGWSELRKAVESIFTD